MRVQVAPGTRARVFVDGLDEALDGRVRWVANEAAFTPYFALTEHDRGRLSYAAKVDVLNATRRLPDGVPVEVELLIGNTSE
jgi:HlyD family secretion protein